MSENPVADAIGLLTEAVHRVRTGDSRIPDEELLDLLRGMHDLAQRATQGQVAVVAELQRRGVFARAGHRRPESAVASLLGVERGWARQIVRAAERTSARVDADGREVTAVLPATAAAFAAGAVGLRHVDVIARLLDSPGARELAPDVHAEVERQLATMAGRCTPTELRQAGATLIRRRDRAGAEAEGREPAQVNELHLTPLPSGGGLLKGRFDDPIRFATIAALIDAKSAPLTADDERGAAERQADALADVCGWVAAHGDTDVVPEAGGHRPQVIVTVPLADLENRAHAACLDLTGDTPTPGALRALCCDAAVIPAVLGGASQPLDVGRATRTIPDGLRRAVTVRDRGCAHPGCDRPPSWSEIHHIREWVHGGATKLNNLVMLCRVHHRDIHSTDWIVRIARDGLPEFIPPPWIDKSRRPRRHPRATARPDGRNGPPGHPRLSIPPGRHRAPVGAR